MLLHDHSTARDESPGSFLPSHAGLVLVGFIVLAGASLLTEHRAHVLGSWLWLLPLSCLVMHLFMHGGHAGRGPEDRSGGTL